MANLQIKGIDEKFYSKFKEVAASENRTISQQVLHILKSYMANKKQFQQLKTPGQVLLDLSGSWDDSRNSEEIISHIKKARKNSNKLKRGF